VTRAALLTRPFVLSCTAVSLGALAPNLFIVAPRYLRAHGLTEDAIGAVMGAFSLAGLVMTPFVAPIADRYGRRLPAVCGLLLTGAAAGLFEAAHSVIGFAVVRLLGGLGWGLALVGGGIYATELAPPGRLGQALGVAGILTLVAIALGPALAEWIVARSSWPWLFRTAAALGVIAAGVASFLPPRPGAISAPAGGPLVVFDRATRPAVLATFLSASGFGANVAFLADLTSQRHLGSVAPFFNAYVAMAIVARLAFGNLSDRLGRRPVIVPALIVQAIALVGIAFMQSGWLLWPLGLLFGLAHGLSYPALQALVVERAPPPMRAAAMATSNFAFLGGMTAAIFVCGAVARHAGYTAVYFLCASLLLASASVVSSDRTAVITAD